MGVDLSRALAIDAGCQESDLHWLAVAARAAGRILEFGSYRGRSLRAMLDNSDAVAWCVDSWRGVGPGRRKTTTSDFLAFLANTVDLSSRVVLLKMTTREAGAILPAGHFDLVFLDASHQYEDVRHDIAIGKRCLSPGGLLCGHDCGAGWDGVDRAVGELVPDFLHAAGAIWYQPKGKG
jgi:predicted O-methyltransferase YrrM